jgi:hypothetical protein
MGSVRSTGTQMMVQGTSESHRIIYGQIQVSGIFYPLGVTGPNNEYLHFLLVYACHECDTFGQLNVAGEAATVDGSGNVTSGKYAGLMTVKSHLGAWNQTVDTDVQAAFGSSFWPSTARLQGRAYDYFRIKYDQNVAGAGIPVITRLIKGRKVYDWRDGTQDPSDPGTWKWSPNAALCNADWLMGVPMKNGAGNVTRNFGFRAQVSEVSSADVIESANICDEAISLAAGGTEARYECHGLIQTTAMRGDVQDALRSAMIGDVCFIGGAWIIRAGAYRTPNATVLTADDFRAPITNLQVKPSRRDVVNGVKGTYVSPTNNWQASDFPAYTKQIPAANLVNGDRVMIVVSGSTNWTAIGSANNNVGTIFTATGAGSGTGYAESYIVEDGGDRLWLDIELPFTVSPTMAQRIAKIHLERLRQTITFVGHYKLTALQHQVTDVVSQTFDRYGWSLKPFRIEGFVPVIEDQSGTPVIGCDLTMRETAPAVYDWNPSEERAADIAPNTTLPNPFVVVTPSGLSVTDLYEQQSDGTYLPKIKLSWTLPADQFMLSGGIVHVQYKLHTDISWVDAASAKGDQVFTFIIGLLALNAYDFRISFENGIGSISPTWATITNHTIPAANPPPDPTNANGYGGVMAAGFTNQQVPPIFNGSGLRRYGTIFRWSESAASNPYGSAGGYLYPSDFDHWEIKGTATDSDAATDYNVDDGSGVAGLIKTNGTKVALYTDAIVNSYVRLRAVNASGVASNWRRLGLLGTGDWAPPGGSMMEQQQTSPKMTGVKIGGSGLSTSASTTNTDGWDRGIYTTVGGSTNETFSLGLPAGFSAKPKIVLIELNSALARPVSFYYDYDDVLNSSSVARIHIHTTDGSTFGAGEGYAFGFKALA